MDKLLYAKKPDMAGTKIYKKQNITISDNNKKLHSDNNRNNTL